ncbi:hypothetical protein JQN72_16135 [Phycicoccus sp. CSK15P-2]|uniref:hypothetical protein n=1 Tax=Phycicoccus sp. CSK15P-2 TaxID=2807627 RepID=UPI00194F2CBE|nr:hypothetical protein [Phycicoccus sp. CSK15P-2]MBM6405773.1 hypothetical protein [Phycicoccus sp. CSK15P-2]
MTIDNQRLATEPPAYWTRLAYEAVIGFIRREQERRGFSQPQFWILRHLSPDDLSSDGRAMTPAELRSAMAEYIRPEDDLEAEASTLASRGLLARDDSGAFALTEEGEATRLCWKDFGPEIRAMIHAGIDDADYITTVKVLQRLISNTSSGSGLSRPDGG